MAAAIASRPMRVGNSSNCLLAFSERDFVPSFSVIIATHRRASLLERALASLHAQTYPCHQIVVVSDVQDSETYLVIDSSLRDGDLFIQRKGEPGPAHSRNVALRLVTGDFILFLDDDDTFRPDFLEKLSGVINGTATERIYYTNCEVLNEGGEQPEPPQFIDISGFPPAWAYVKNFIPNNCQVFPRTIAEKIRFDPAIAYEDWDYLLSACAHGELCHVPIGGPVIHKNVAKGGEHRGEKNQTGLLECYIKVYGKHPPITLQVAELRRQLFSSVGIEIDGFVSNKVPEVLG